MFSRLRTLADVRQIREAQRQFAMQSAGEAQGRLDNQLQVVDDLSAELASAAHDWNAAAANTLGDPGMLRLWAMRVLRVEAMRTTEASALAACRTDVAASVADWYDCHVRADMAALQFRDAQRTYRAARQDAMEDMVADVFLARGTRK